VIGCPEVFRSIGKVNVSVLLSCLEVVFIYLGGPQETMELRTAYWHRILPGVDNVFFRACDAGTVRHLPTQVLRLIINLNILSGTQVSSVLWSHPLR